MSKSNQSVKRAAIYVRVSTVRQGEDGGGLDAQLAECRRYATALGYEIVLEEHDMVSGRELDKREGLDRILRAGRKGEFDVLVVREVSRFARRAKDALAVADELTDLGIEVTDVKGQSSSNKLLFTILAAIAEYEADLIRERAVGGRVVAAQNGRWIGGSPPFGYRVADDGTLELDEDEAPVIESIFNMAVQPDKYTSALSIARELRKRGVRPRVRDWGDRDVSQVFGHSHIQSYLTDPVYKGEGRDVKIGGESFNLPAPAIVGVDVFERAREVVAKRRKQFHKNAHKRTYALSGRLTHRHEDGTEWSMRGEMKIRRGKYASEIRLYRCATAKEPGVDCPGMEVEGPRRTTVNADDVEARVLGWALDHLSDPDLFAETIRAHQHAVVGAREDAQAREDLQERLDSIPVRRGRWIEQYGDGLIDKTIRDAKLADLDQEELDLRNELAQVERDAAVTPDELLDELRTADLADFEPEPGEWDPTDAEWPDVQRFLRQVVVEYAETRDPLPALAQRWVAHVAEVLDLRLVVIDRDMIEEDWIGSRNG